jgi:hypothetical protein
MERSPAKHGYGGHAKKDTERPLPGPTGIVDCRGQPGPALTRGRKGDRVPDRWVFWSSASELYLLFCSDLRFWCTEGFSF